MALLVVTYEKVYFEPVARMPGMNVEGKIGVVECDEAALTHKK